jgi:hypothetical protein
MSDFGLTNPHETLLGHPVTNATSDPSVAGRSGDAGTAALAPAPTSPEWSPGAPTANPARRPRARRWLANRRGARLAATVLMCAAIGLPVSFATSPSATAAPLVAASASSTGAPNARSAPAQGGASGTVASVFKSSFTVTTSAGQKVTVDEKSSTTYDKGTSSTSATAVTKGQSVLALGTVNSTTITATQVVVGYKPAASAKATTNVVPFEKGETTASKEVGQIPANWSAGSGTIVSGATANEATEAALAAYPGGIIDRVVKLSNGEYNVHYIGVNWPHHVFESASFKVVGAL